MAKTLNQKQSIRHKQHTCSMMTHNRKLRIEMSNLCNYIIYYLRMFQMIIF